MRVFEELVRDWKKAKLSWMSFTLRQKKNLSVARGILLSMFVIILTNCISLDKRVTSNYENQDLVISDFLNRIYVKEDQIFLYGKLYNIEISDLLALNFNYRKDSCVESFYSKHAIDIAIYAEEDHEVNEVVLDVSSSIAALKNVSLISRTELNTMELIPNSKIIIFSKLTYFGNKDYAVFSMTRISGPLSGERSLILYKKIGDKYFFCGKHLLSVS